MVAAPSTRDGSPSAWARSARSSPPASMSRILPPFTRRCRRSALGFGRPPEHLHHEAQPDGFEDRRVDVAAGARVADAMQLEAIGAGTRPPLRREQGADVGDAVIGGVRPEITIELVRRRG